VPSDDVDDSKVIEDVHIHSEISSVVEDPLVNPGTPIIDEKHVSFARTSDVVNVLMESSIRITNETNVYENDQEIQETEIESIVATPSMSSSSESIEFLVILHQIN